MNRARAVCSAEQVLQRNILCLSPSQLVCIQIIHILHPSKNYLNHRRNETQQFFHLLLIWTEFQLDWGLCWMR